MIDSEGSGSLLLGGLLGRGVGFDVGALRGTVGTVGDGGGGVGGVGGSVAMSEAHGCCYPLSNVSSCNLCDDGASLDHVHVLLHQPIQVA